MISIKEFRDIKWFWWAIFCYGFRFIL